MFRITDPLWGKLTHWGRVTHICVSKLTIIGLDNGLSPDRRQAIIWTSAGLLLIGPLWTNFSETLIEILTFSFKKMHLKISYAKWRPFCLGPYELSSGIPNKTASAVEMVSMLWRHYVYGACHIYSYYWDTKCMGITNANCRPTYRDMASRTHNSGNIIKLRIHTTV